MTQSSKWRKTAVLLAAVVLTACTSAAQKQAQHLQRGSALFQAGDYQKARLEFQNVLQINPKNAAALLALSKDLEKLGEWRRAAGGYRRVIDLVPGNVEAKLRLAKIYVLAGVVDQADKLVTEVGNVRPADPDMLTLRGAIEARRGDTSAAMKDARSALGGDPRQLDATMLLSSMYVRQGRYADAVSLLQRGIHAHADNMPLRLALADAYDHQKQTASAIDQLKEVIRLDPKGLVERVRLARYEDHLGRTEAARQVLEQAVSDDTRSTPAKLALVNFLAAHHQSEQARERLQGYIRQFPDDYALRFGLATLYRGDKQLDKAEAVYRQIIGRDGTGPDGLKARTQLAALLATRGRTAEAKTLVSQVLKEDATDDKALILRGMIALNEHDPQTAVSALRTVQHDRPDSARIAQLLAQAYLLDGHTSLAKDQLRTALKLDPSDTKLRLQLAKVLAQNATDRDEAVGQIRAVLKQSPHDGDALKALFGVQMAESDWTSAAATAKRIEGARPADPLGSYLMGLAYQGDKRYTDSVAQWRLALDKQPRAIQPLTALVKMDVARHRNDDALKEIRRVLKHAPDDAVAYNLEGEVLLAEHKTKEAMVSFRQAIKHNAAWVIPYRNLAAAYLAQKDTKGAIRTYREGLKAAGEAQQLRFDLASLYEGEGDHDAAIAQYQRALTKDPGSAAAANNLAMMLVTYRHDRVSLRKARALVNPLADAANPAYLDTFGWVLYKSGEVAPAVKAIQAAVEKAPKSGLLRYHLGMVLYSEGQKEAARKNLQVALQGGEKFYGRDQAKATLDKIAGL